MGPPAVGKSTLANLLSPDFVPEPLPELRRARLLPPPGLVRQHLLLDVVAAVATQEQPYTKIFDAGPISTLAFTRCHFGGSAALDILLSTVGRFGVTWIALDCLIWLDAPVEFLVTRAKSDSGRRRRNFDSNIENFRDIRRVMSPLFALLPAERGIMVRADVPYEIERATRLVMEKRQPRMDPGYTLNVLERWLK